MACPICNKEPQQAHRPFCSKGCSDIDLNRWLNGQYGISDSGEITCIEIDENLL